MALENLVVYRIVTGDSTYPHSGSFTIANAGNIVLDDSNGSRDWEFGDFTHTGGSDAPDQDVTSSTVSGITNGDTVDSRYKYTFTGSDGSSGTIYFIATNGDADYGPLIVSDTPLSNAVTYTFGTFNTDGAVAYNTLVQCFVRGTRVETERGLVAIEDLEIDDMVVTMDNGLQPIRWIGMKTVRAEGALAPIRIKAGALGNSRDLLVSPQHRMLMSGWRLELMFATDQALATAKSLINDKTIMRQPGGMVDYFHILFDRHEIVFAEGAATESFHPGQQSLDALGDETREEIFALFPELRISAETYGPLARLGLKPQEARLVA